MHLCRVIQIVRIRPHRRPASRMTKHPVLLKVRNMSDFPQKWIDGLQQRYAKLIVGKVVDKLQGSVAGVVYTGFERLRYEVRHVRIVPLLVRGAQDANNYLDHFTWTRVSSNALRSL